MMRSSMIACAAGALLFLAGFWLAETKRPPYGAFYELYDTVRNLAIVDTIYDTFVPGAREAEPPAEPVDTNAPPNKHWNPAPGTSPAAEGDGADRAAGEGDGARDRAREAIEALGYLGGYEESPGYSGVTRYDSARAQPGLNFHTTGAACAALLTDMHGNVLHEWGLPFEQAFPDFRGDVRPGSTYWFYASLFENGSVIATSPHTGIVCVDKDSRLVWAREGDYHHTFDRDRANGTIVALFREPDRIPAYWDDETYCYDEKIVTIDAATGELLHSVSIVAAIERSPYAAVAAHAGIGNIDKLHTNTVQILDGRFDYLHPAFRAGNILTSFRNIDTIGILDLESETLVWALTGLFDHQHRPTFRDDGTILVFNNDRFSQRSEIAAINPLTQARVWTYTHDEFYTEISGVAWPLANGNVLATEATAGRVFEVTPGGAVVWEYYATERWGENDEMIPTLFEMYRHPPGYADAWLERGDSESNDS